VLFLNISFAIDKLGSFVSNSERRIHPLNILTPFVRLGKALLNAVSLEQFMNI
jgi:hypothetical protein